MRNTLEDPKLSREAREELDRRFKKNHIFQLQLKYAAARAEKTGEIDFCTEPNDSDYGAFNVTHEIFDLLATTG